MFNYLSGKFCFSVTSVTLIEMGILPNAAILLLLSRVLFLVVTMAYYYHLGRKPKKIWSDHTKNNWQQTTNSGSEGVGCYLTGVRVLSVSALVIGTYLFVTRAFNREAQHLILNFKTIKKNKLWFCQLVFRWIVGSSCLWWFIFLLHPVHILF